jgi:hypothetical protein
MLERRLFPSTYFCMLGGVMQLKPTGLLQTVEHLPLVVDVALNSGLPPSPPVLGARDLTTADQDADGEDEERGKGGEKDESHWVLPRRFWDHPKPA